MARFNSFCIMVVFFLSSGVFMVSPSLARTQIIKESIVPASEETDIFPPAPSIDDFSDDEGDMAPEVAPELRDYLNNCGAKLTDECGEEIFSSIFKNGAYSDECCRKLVVMGKPCNDAMVKFIVSIPEMKLNASEILPKSEQVWNKCVSIAAALAPTPSSSS